jgi:hypothetical protein
METSASFEARSAPLPYPTRLMEGFRCRCREHLPLESVAPLEACLQLPWGALPRAPALSLRLSTRIQVTSIPSVSSPASHSPSSCDGSRNVQASPRSGANPSAFSRSCWSRWRGGTTDARRPACGRDHAGRLRFQSVWRQHAPCSSALRGAAPGFSVFRAVEHIPVVGDALVL